MFVTRLKKRTRYKVQERGPVKSHQGVSSDQTIRLSLSHPKCQPFDARR